MIAALYVAKGGCYYASELAGEVDPWPEDRDARLYAGPDPVIAHPPCERYGRYWSGGPNPRSRRRLMGDDDGCFDAARYAVCVYGGVLEHPAASHAFRLYGIPAPPGNGGWLSLVPLVSKPRFIEWICCVEQGHYGHPARKRTWLLASLPPGVAPPGLIWGPSVGRRLDEGFHSKAERDAARAAGIPPRKRLSARENLATPIPFRDVLLSIARSARAREAA